MTEAEWLACESPPKMLAYLGLKVSDRKLRLFAAACCRRSWRKLTNEQLRRSIEMAELFADGKVSQRERGSAFAAAEGPGGTVKTSPRCVAYAASLCSVKDIRLWIGTIWYQSIGGPIQQHSSTAALLREVVGNPFRRVSVAAAWLAWNDGIVPKLAQGAYDERAFDRLPVLADALEEAGYTDANLLGHLRGPGPHVRGCWALDLILGKE
jgi:hypothetical protein